MSSQMGRQDVLNMTLKEGMSMRASELQYLSSQIQLSPSKESQLIKCLPDHLNAEIVLGTIQTIEEAVEGG
jgi:pre-mRNA-splicing helicase BRR2